MNNQTNISSLDYIKMYKGKVIPADLFDALLQLLGKIEDSQKACKLAREIENNLVSSSISMSGTSEYNCTLELSLRDGQQSAILDLINKHCGFQIHI